MDDLADTAEVVMVATEVGDAVPAIWAREVQNGVIAGLVPGHIFRCDQALAKGKCLAED